MSVGFRNVVCTCGSDNLVPCNEVGDAIPDFDKANIPDWWQGDEVCDGCGRIWFNDEIFAAVAGDGRLADKYEG